MPIFPAARREALLAALGRTYDERTTTEAHGYCDNHGRDARIGREHLSSHACASRNYLQFVTHALKIVSGWQRGEKRVAYRLEDGVIGKFERSRQGKVCRIEE